MHITIFEKPPTMPGWPKSNRMQISRMYDFSDLTSVSELGRNPLIAYIITVKGIKKNTCIHAFVLCGPRSLSYTDMTQSHSVFQIRLDWDKCNQCGNCRNHCRAGCISPQEKQIDLSRCIVCFNCLDICHQDAIHLKPKSDSEMASIPNSGKRRFLKGGLVYCLSAVSVGLPVRSFAHLKFQGKRNSVITPPGSKGVRFFSEKCTACHLCLSVCEEKVLQPALSAYGLSGVSQPIMDFNKGKCAYDCNACGQVCPTGAIGFLPLKTKQLTQIGTVELTRDRCIVYQKKRDWGACAEVCPTHAVHTKIKNNVAYPKISVDSCIGCGACQKVCPTLPKSIMIHPNEIHSIARKPIYSDPPEPDYPTPETEAGEFPF